MLAVMVGAFSSLLVAVGLLAFDPTTLQVPPEWVLERPPPYANVLVALRHRSGVTLTIGRQYLGVGEDDESFARGNVPAIQALGLAVQRSGGEVQALSRNGRWKIMQTYVVIGKVGWVVTMAGAPPELGPLRRDYGSFVAQIRGGP